jgi:hypothetical protein
MRAGSRLPLVPSIAAAAVAATLLLGARTARTDESEIHASLREFLPTGKYVFRLKSEVDADEAKRRAEKDANGGGANGGGANGGGAKRGSPEAGEPGSAKTVGAEAASPPAASAPNRPRVYFSLRASAYLVLDTPAKHPLLVHGGLKPYLQSFPTESLIGRADGGWDVRADVALNPIGPATLDGAAIVFDCDGVEARLVPPEPLLGWLKPARLVDEHPEYERDARKYSPNAASMEALRKRTEEVRVFIYFGTWCPTCNLVIGSIMRVERDLSKERTNFRVDYYGLPRAPDAWEDPEAKKAQVEQAPTGTVYLNEKFIGRIVGNAWIRPEAALAELLRKSGK